jgi:ornithine--oxo-acid transaminase
MDSGELMALVDRHGAQNYKPLPVVLDQGEGVFVWDVEGRRYLDCLSCYSALNHGHRHPKVIQALLDQAARLTLTSRAFHNTQMGPFLKELCAYTGMEMALPMNTGAEAVETAIKAVRKWGYLRKGVPRDRAEIVVCANNFHGRTVTIVTFSTEPLYREDFGPFTPGFRVIPYGSASELEAAITPETVAFLVEPIQGEAGVIVPPDGFLAAAREITSRHGVLLVADEIQTGFGRTGRRFCWEHETAKPDLIVLGKALGGGVYPVSAVAGTAEVLGLFRPGEHGSTFGGNPLACAVARASLAALEDEKLHERADALGREFLARLKSISSRHIRAVRGRGLLIGMELHPEAGGARRFCEALMADGVLCKETHVDVIRFAPPLVITAEQLAWVADRVADVMGRL